MRKLILVTAILFLGVMTFVSSFIKAKQQRRILAATVMISMTAPNWQETTEGTDAALPIPPDEYRTMARAEGEVVADGLGTLVANGDELLLVTHDHWSLFDEALGRVTVRAADGTLLVEMDLRAFRQHVRHRDGGTMVLTAPEMPAMVVPGRAVPMSVGDFGVGDGVLLAQRAGDGVTVTEARVVATGEKQGRPVVQLRGTDGQTVVGGDSGGGVWVNGRFAATTWTTVRMENTATGAQRATELSVAAVYAPSPSAHP